MSEQMTEPTTVTGEASEPTSETLTPPTPPEVPGNPSEVTGDTKETSSDAAGAEPTGDEPADDGPADGEDRQAKEAAKYRRRLRETERERDQAQEQLTAARRQLAEQASGLTHPAGLWAAGTELDSLFGEDGSLDREALAQATQEAVAKLGLRMGGRPPRPNPAQDGPAGGRPRLTPEDVVLGRVR